MLIVVVPLLLLQSYAASHMNTYQANALPCKCIDQNVVNNLSVGELVNQSSSLFGDET